ncbi:MAG: tyrosine--tRNA ligase [Candidatus Paceibacterota bacterium]|jgi:tyrosyl-tRNA synthetase
MKNENLSKIEEILTRGVEEVIDKDNLRKKLLSGKKLRIKLGIDPTSPNLHIGRSVTLLKLRDFQELGHKIVFIIGDFTGVVGDTSDKDSERPMLDKKTVQNNLKTYTQQVGKIIDLKKSEVKRNSQWLSKLGFEDITKQANMFSLTEFISRENIKKRLDQQKSISLREVLYPLMQGYDSVAVKADVEVGGTDQKFNLLAGREIQRNYGQKPQDIIMLGLIEGLDGRKMSSSWGNTINLNDEPKDMFGKVMKLEDNLLIKYFTNCTRVPMEEVDKYNTQIKNGANPRDIKMVLAYEITRMYWGEKEADKAKDFFVSAFQKKETPTDIETIKGKKDQTYFDIIFSTKEFKSRGELLRLFQQGGIKTFPEHVVIRQSDKAKEGIIKVGKKNFFKVILR